MDKLSSVKLAHGDGGAAAVRFVRQEILSRFDNSILNTLEDASWVEWDCSRIVISTDSYIVDPPIFPGGDIGKLAISGTINDLLAAGAAPRFLSFSLILTEGFPFAKLRHILDSASQTAESALVKIVAGDTKVLPSRAGTEIYINTTGLGYPIRSDKNFAVSHAQPGDNIIVTGSIGDHGFAIISTREGLGFEQRVISDCAPLHKLIGPLLNAYEGIRCLRDPTRGGIIGVLIDIAESSDVDVIVDEEMIPIKKEVRYGCEMLGLDPLNLANEGKFVIVVAPEQTNIVMAQLRQHSLGSESTVIGAVRQATLSHGHLYLRRQKTTRVVIRPEGQNLPRLC